MSGYTQVNNDVFDNLMASLSPVEFKVYMALYRKIIGWNKESDIVAIGQLVELTNASDKSVRTSIKKLAEKGLFVAEKSYNNMYKITYKVGNDYRADSDLSAVNISTSPVIVSSSPVNISTSPVIVTDTKDTKQNTYNKIHITKERDISKIPKTKKTISPGTKKRKSDATEVFEYWILKTNSRETKKVWLPSIEARLKTFSVEDIKQAMDNIIASKWHQENNQVSLKNVVSSDKRLDEKLNRKPTKKAFDRHMVNANYPSSQHDPYEIPLPHEKMTDSRITEEVAA